jgi:hypothetical protein
MSDRNYGFKGDQCSYQVLQESKIVVKIVRALKIAISSV